MLEAAGGGDHDEDGEGDHDVVVVVVSAATWEALDSWLDILWPAILNVLKFLLRLMVMGVVVSVHAHQGQVGLIPMSASNCPKFWTMALYCIPDEHHW